MKSRRSARSANASDTARSADASDRTPATLQGEPTPVTPLGGSTPATLPGVFGDCCDTALFVRPRLMQTDPVVKRIGELRWERVHLWQIANDFSADAHDKAATTLSCVHCGFPKGSRLVLEHTDESKRWAQQKAAAASSEPANPLENPPQTHYGFLVSRRCSLAICRNRLDGDES